MLMEQRGKAGGFCDLAKEGKLRCPLIVRQTSEDVVTNAIASTIQVLNPRWWLPDFMNRALGTDRFQRQVFRKLRIEAWQKQPRFPRHLTKWDEGQTEVDIVISWENPAWTVFVEMKYGSNLSATTTHNAGQTGYPADQLIRNARVGLYQCGWYDEPKLFDVPTREFALILLSPGSNHPLVAQYRNRTKLLEAIPFSERIKRLPTSPFIGELSYGGFCRILNEQRKWFSRPERLLLDLLTDYLQFKNGQLRERNGKGN